MATAARQMAKQLRNPAIIELTPLTEHPRMRPLLDREAANNKRTAQATHREKVALARLRGDARPSRPAEMRAADLEAGGSVTILPPDAELAAAREELTILNAGRIDILQQIERLKSELSFEACQQFAPMNADALRQALDSATSLFQALEAARVIRGRLLGAGYQLNETALPVHQFPAGAALGDPERRSLTPAGMFRDWLAERGII